MAKAQNDMASSESGKNSNEEGLLML